MPRIRSHPRRGSSLPSRPRDALSLRYPSVQSNPGADPNPGLVSSSTDSSFRRPAVPLPPSPPRSPRTWTPHDVQQIPVYAWLQTASSAALPPRLHLPRLHPADSILSLFIPVYPRRADRPMPIAVKQCSFNVFFFHEIQPRLCFSTTNCSGSLARWKPAVPPFLPPSLPPLLLIATASIRRDVDFLFVCIAIIIVIIKR